MNDLATRNEVIEAVHVITPRMIKIVAERIEFMMSQNPTSRVTVDYREFAEYFECSEQMMKDILRDIYNNPTKQMRETRKVNRVRDFIGGS
jgi:hypothetical protein